MKWFAAMASYLKKEKFVEFLHIVLKPIQR